METWSDIERLAGLGGLSASERWSLLGKVALALIPTLGIAYALSPSAGAVVGFGLIPAIVYAAWLRLRRRTYPRRLAALALTVLPATLALASALGVRGFSAAAAPAHLLVLLGIGLVVAWGPALLALLVIAALENARRVDPFRATACGALILGLVGVGVGARVGVPEAAVGFGLALAFQGGVLAFKFACVSQLFVLEGDGLEEERREQDPCLRQGVSAAGAARVYRTVSRFIHADGAVDAAERSALEGLRLRFEISPERGEELEAAGVALDRIQVGSNPRELALLVRSLLPLLKEKETLHLRERRIVRAVYSAMGLLEADQPSRCADPSGSQEPQTPPFRAYSRD